MEKTIQEKLAVLLRFATIASPMDGKEDEAAFSGCRQAILDLFPDLVKACDVHLVIGRGLVLQWKGQTDDAPWVLMAHYDIVPATESGWLHPPFSGHIDDTHVYGRGALDTKGTLACMLEAAQNLARKGFVPRQDIFFCFSGDEETYGPTTPAIIEFLQQRGQFPAFVLDEGGGMERAAFTGYLGLAALVGVAEKGMANIRLSATGPGGHASVPPNDTQTDLLVRAMNRIRRQPFPQRLTAPVRATLRALSPVCGFPWNTMYKFPDAFQRLLFGHYGRQAGKRAALLRTTCALTRMQGSQAPNVLPDTAWAGYNLRLLPGDTPDSCWERLESIVDDPRVKVELVDGNAPSPVSTSDGPAFERIVNAVRAVWPDAVTAPMLMTGATDAYYYSLLCDQVYRFSPLLVTSEESACVHAANERVPIKALHEAVRFYEALINTFLED